MGVLRQFDRELDVHVYGDTECLEAGASAWAEAAWLLVDAEGLGLALDQTLAMMRERAPAARIVAFGTSAADHEIDQLMGLGVSAYVPRRFGLDATLAVLALVSAGERFRPVSDEPVASSADGYGASSDPADTLRQFGLTKAEHEVLLRVVQGKTNMQIALQLDKKEGTVRIQMSNILRKLKVRSRSEAILVALREPTVIDALLELIRDKPLDLAWLHPHMVHRRCRAGETLFRQGDLGKEMYIVQRGCVSLPQLGIEMHENDMFGEISIFAPNHRRTSSAVCTMDTHLFVLTESTVHRMYFLNPAFALTLLKLITNRLLADRQRAG